MQTNPIQPSEAVAAIQDALNQTDSNRKSTLQVAGEVLAAKLRSLQGKAAPAPVTAPLSPSAQARIAHYQSLSQAVDAMRVQDNHQPAPAPESFVIHGRVTDSQGQPLANHVLKLTDPSQTLKDRIPPVPSGQEGFFTLTLRSAEFPDLVNNKTDLFITVTDKAGREIYSPRSQSIWNRERPRCAPRSPRSSEGKSTQRN
jgi:hypothetical protein